MTSGMTAFMVAVGGTSLICYLLMNRVQNRRAQSRSAGDSFRHGSATVPAASGWSIFPGSAATVLRRIIPARSERLRRRTAEEAVAMAVAAAAM